MCLDKITRKNVTLKKDTTVWKIMGYNEKSRHYYHGYFICRKEKVKKGINKVEHIIELEIPMRDKYISGYHCFLNERDANKFNIFSTNRAKIRKFVIPKGTKVTLGLQIDHHYDNLKVIVTPILIN